MREPPLGPCFHRSLHPGGLPLAPLRYVGTFARRHFEITQLHYCCDPCARLYKHKRPDEPLGRCCEYHDELGG